MIRKIFIAAAIGFCALCFPTAASAAEPGLPLESSLAVVPGAVTWPSSPEFEYRLSLRSGPEGADFSFSFPHEAWGPADVGGTPFSQGEPFLDGPGELKVESMLVGDPSPTACVRGAFGFGQTNYRLSMEPNSETTVTMPSALLAAPVSGMNRSVSAQIGSSLFTAPIAINGREDVRILGRVPGSTPFGTTWLRPRENFRIAGRTVPVMKNRLLRFHAEQRIGFAGVLSPPEFIATARTDGRGRFRTPPMALRKSGTWVLTSRVNGAPEESFSCNGAVEVGRETEPASIRTLDGRNFVSSSVKGPGAKPEKIELSFSRGTIYDENMEVLDENGPLMIADAGCNSMAGGYQVRKGRLRWSGPVSGTVVGCSDDRDSWLYSRLGKGLTATFVGKTLVLKGRRGVLIRLKTNR